MVKNIFEQKVSQEDYLTTLNSTQPDFSNPFEKLSRIFNKTGLKYVWGIALTWTVICNSTALQSHLILITAVPAIIYTVVYWILNNE